jgi:hypothetical protein
MNLENLRKWLELPPGPWPPDDRTLLALPANFTAMDVEFRALAQMEKLRPHQLVQPELVTEGMNRLAQALDNLTREAQRVVPPSTPPKPTAPKPADDDIILDASKLPGQPPKPAVKEAEVVSVQQQILEAEIVPQPPRSKKKKKKRRAKATKPRLREESVRIPKSEVVPPGVAYSPEERRKGYRELVALRRVMRNWEKLQPYFAVPSERVETPSAVFGFLEATRDCRTRVAVDADREWFDESGKQVLTILRSPFCLAVFRSLVREQRRELATDWAYTIAHLRGRYQGLRDEMRETVPRNTLRQSLRDLADLFRTNPEWMLVGLILLTIGVALLRTAMAK